MTAPTSDAATPASAATLVSPAQPRAASRASRVLPQPPGPVRHTSGLAGQQVTQLG